MEPKKTYKVNPCIMIFGKLIDIMIEVFGGYAYTRKHAFGFLIFVIITILAITIAISGIIYIATLY